MSERAHQVGRISSRLGAPLQLLPATLLTNELMTELRHLVLHVNNPGFNLGPMVLSEPGLVPELLPGGGGVTWLVTMRKEHM